MAGRKNFVSGSILTAADVNAFLMDQSVMVFDDGTARGSAIPTPSEGMVTYLKDLNQVQAYDGSAFTSVGKILQVVSTGKSNTFSASVAAAGVVEVTGLTVSLTPAASANKVLVTVDLTASSWQSNGYTYATLYRNGSPVYRGDAAGSRQRVSSGGIGSDGSALYSISISFLDSPGSTSALTYSVYLSHESSSTRTLYVNRGVTDSDSSVFARGASTITATEVTG